MEFVFVVPRAKLFRDHYPQGLVPFGSDFPLEASLDLGKLRAFKGSQRYQIPAGTDLGKYNSVVIWCRQFGVLISPADLNFEAGV